MTYCIMTVIYGVPLTEDVSEWLSERTPEDGISDDPDAEGFTMLYSGSARWMPVYCGVKLCEFNECRDAIPVDGLKLVATDEQKREAEKLVAALDSRIRERCPPIGCYIIPSSS